MWIRNEPSYKQLRKSKNGHHNTELRTYKSCLIIQFLDAFQKASVDIQIHFFFYAFCIIYLDKVRIFIVIMK